MKITAIETFLVPPRLQFLRIATDEGVVGWGEPVIEGRAQTVAAAVHEAADHLIGQDPLHVEEHWQVLTRGSYYRGGPILSSAVAGIDQALWDIIGKVRGAPVHELLGGRVRERIRMYSWVRGDTPDEYADSARAAVDAGYSAVKMCPVKQASFIGTPEAVDAMLERVAAVRETIGDERDLAIDLRGRVSLPSARRLLPLLEAYTPMFVEEPVRPEFSSLLRQVVTASAVPIATGERLYSRTDFKPVLEAGVAVVQPDISHAGGISEVRRIAALAEMYDAAVAPHCPLGPIALAASLQIAAAVPNFLIQEQSIGIENPANVEYADPSAFALVDGYVVTPQSPGLGVAIDEEAVRAADRVGHRFRSPIWRLPDGSLTEW